MTTLGLYPALATWRKRVRNIPSHQWVFDNLWRAACHERSAQDAEAYGQRKARWYHRRQARFYREAV